MEAASWRLSHDDAGPFHPARAADHTGRSLRLRQALIVVVAFASIGVFFGIAIVDSIGLLVLTLIILGRAFNRGALMAELSQTAPLSRQSMITGLNQSLMSGTNIAAPLLSGALFDRGLYYTRTVAKAAIAICGAIITAALLAPRSAEATTPGKPHARPEQSEIRQPVE